METPQVSKFQDVIDAYKEKGIETYELKTSTGHVCIVRQPTVLESAKFQPYLYAIAFGNMSVDLVEFGKKMVKDLWLTGDDEVRTIESNQIETAAAIISVIKMNVAEVKKN